MSSSLSHSFRTSLAWSHCARYPPNTGCQSGWACVIGIPYYSPSDIYGRPAGSTPADSACSPQALCIHGTTCVFTDPYGNGICRAFCDLSGSPHGCSTGEHCAMIYHPTIGICVP